MAVVARLLARLVRERREDREDAITAAHWRAANAPHLVTDTDRIHLQASRAGGRRVRAGVA